MSKYTVLYTHSVGLECAQSSHWLLRASFTMHAMLVELLQMYKLNLCKSREYNYLCLAYTSTFKIRHVWTNYACYTRTPVQTDKTKQSIRSHIR